MRVHGWRRCVALVLLLLAVDSSTSATFPVAPRDDTPPPTAQRLTCSPGDMVVSTASAATYVLREHVRLLGVPTATATLDPLPPPPHPDGVVPARRVPLSSVVDDARAGAAPHRYSLDDLAGRGHCGEVWRAVRLDDDGGGDGGGATYVLKRVFPNVPGALASGWREVHFGAALAGVPGVTRFVESFMRAPPGAPDAGADAAPPEPELWLVFRDEGVSLQRLLFLPAGGAVAPSPFWVRTRTQPAGAAVVRSLARQLLAALAAVHARGVTHRDVKPGNVLVGTADGTVVLRLADWGSGVDAHALARLYPADGPSTAEETADYAPPEVVFTGVPYDEQVPASYDAFAAGVTLLELVLGVPASAVFAPDPRLEALMHQSHGTREGSRKGKNGGGAPGGGGDDGRLAAALRAAGYLALCVAPSAADVAAGAVPPAMQHVLAVRALADRHHSHGSGSGSGSGSSSGECGLAGFRRALRTLDLEARKRAGVLAEAAASAAAPGAGATDGGRDEGPGAVWAVPPAGPLVAQRTHEASLAAFGALALVPGDAASAERVDRALVEAAAALRATGHERDPLALPDPADAYASAQGPPSDARALAGGAGVCAPGEGSDDAAGAQPAVPEGGATCAPPLDPLSAPVPVLGEAGEDLLFRLLAWRPQDRLLPADAAAHPYFAARGAGAADDDDDDDDVEDDDGLAGAEAHVDALAHVRVTTSAAG